MAGSLVDLQAKYKQLMAVHLKREEKDLKALNDKFMSGKLSLSARGKAAERIYARTNTIAKRIRAKVLSK